MGFGDKFKNIFNVSEEEYFDDMDMNENDRRDDDYSRDVRSNNFGFNRPRETSDSKVVDMRASAPAATAAKAHVVFKKLDRYEDVGSVADVLNEKRIVILNLETCPNDVSVRINLSPAALSGREDAVLRIHVIPILIHVVGIFAVRSRCVHEGSESVSCFGIS